MSVRGAVLLLAVASGCPRRGPVNVTVPSSPTEPPPSTMADPTSPLASSAGEPVVALRTRGAIWDADPTADGRLLLAVRDLGPAVWRPADGEVVPLASTPEVQKVAVAPDGWAVVAEYERVFARGADGSVSWSRPLPGNAGAIVVVPDGSAVLVASEGELHRLRATDGAIVWSWRCTDADGGSIGAVATDGQVVYVDDGVKAVALDATTGALTRTVISTGENVAVIAIAPAADRLVVGGWDRTFRIVDPRTDFVVAEASTAGWGNGAAWRADGQRVAWIDLEGGVEVRSADGAPLGAWTVPGSSTGGVVWLGARLFAFVDDTLWEIPVGAR